MELFEKATVAAAVESDPGGGEVEPSLRVITPAFDPAAGVGLYADIGARVERAMSENDERRALSILARATVDGLLAVERRVKALDLKRMYAYGVWSTQDSQFTVQVPADRMDGANWTLYRIVALITADSAAASEILSIAGLLPIPFLVTAQQNQAAANASNTIPVYDLPLKSESFVVTKSAGGAFTTKGMLFADFREVNLV